MRAGSPAWRAIRAISGVLLCVSGFVLARATPFRETSVLVGAGGCRMVTDIVDAGEDNTEGSVVLLHGLAANKKIMSYLARGFALVNLRVFVPDLPGHGRTPGPFSVARAEACSEAFVRQLITRGAVDPARTLLAGHSMGGAIALRLSARIPVAGTIAISPAPMVTTYGVHPSMLLFADPLPAPAHTLVLSGSAEPRSVRETSRSLIGGSAAATGQYLVIPRSTHVSLLFDPDVVRASQAWAGRVLHAEVDTPALPGRLPLAGSITGLAGILLLAGPFLRETLGLTRIQTKAEAEAEANKEAPASVACDEPGSPIIAPATSRILTEMGVASLGIVGLLRFWNPFGLLRVFEGDYLAGFLLILGIVLLIVHRKTAGSLLRVKPGTLLAAGFAAIVLPVLLYCWLDLTVSEAWLTVARWLRTPAMCLAVLPYHAAEELLLGPMRARSGKMRLLLGMAIRLVVWSALLLGILVLHNGEILLALLAPYLALFCLLQRWGIDVVRKGTGSPLAAAVFGAILLAGFSVIVFPIT